jgi:hypothetical protein
VGLLREIQIGNAPSGEGLMMKLWMLWNPQSSNVEMRVEPVGGYREGRDSGGRIIPEGLGWEFSRKGNETASNPGLLWRVAGWVLAGWGYFGHQGPRDNLHRHIVLVWVRFQTHPRRVRLILLGRTLRRSLDSLRLWSGLTLCRRLLRRIQARCCSASVD